MYCNVKVTKYETVASYLRNDNPIDENKATTTTTRVKQKNKIKHYCAFFVFIMITM